LLDHLFIIVSLMSEVTRILNAARDGDPTGAGELLPLVCEELRRLAAHRMANEGAGHPWLFSEIRQTLGH
jgi:hypothetical protein